MIGATINTDRGPAVVTGYAAWNEAYVEIEGDGWRSVRVASQVRRYLELADALRRG